MPGPLDGVRVIDLTHVLNGPFATLLLAHLGADVIKIEQPRRGDRYRRAWMPPGATRDWYGFVAVNCGKRGITLDLKSEDGSAIVRRLVEQADVLVENFSIGVMDRLGLGYETLRTINPALVYACSRGFGESGPYSATRSNAAINMAMTGWTRHAQVLQEDATNRAYFLGPGDEASGVSVALGVCAALYERERTGEGKKIEVSMQEALLGFMSSTLGSYSGGGLVDVDAVTCADGQYIFFLPGISDDQMRAIASAIGRPELADDPRFAEQRVRDKNVEALEEALRRWAQGKTRREVWSKMSAVGVSSGPVLSVPEVLDDEHLEWRQAFVRVAQPDVGDVKVVAPWIMFDGARGAVSRSAPALGEHNRDVYRELLGAGDDEIDEWEAKGVI